MTLNVISNEIKIRGGDEPLFQFVFVIPFWVSNLNFLRYENPKT